MFSIGDADCVAREIAKGRETRIRLDNCWKNYEINVVDCAVDCDMAGVAQLVSAVARIAKGCGFESCRWSIFFISFFTSVPNARCTVSRTPLRDNTFLYLIFSVNYLILDKKYKFFFSTHFLECLIDSLQLLLDTIFVQLIVPELLREELEVRMSL